MKKFGLLLLVFLLILVGLAACEEKVVGPDDSPLEFSPTMPTGVIAAFSLETPSADARVTTLPTFTWQSVENAYSYTLEICTSTDFQYDPDGREVYLKKIGLKENRYNLIASLKKETRYYWRVTAINSDHSRVSEGEYGTFEYLAQDLDKIEIPVGYADEWKVHEDGSKATVSLDKNDFFGEDTGDALCVTFKKEDMQREGEKYLKANEWVVLTRSLETEFYKMDAFSFDFYYMGNNATAYFRVIDEDNEYWYAPIKISANTRQSILIPFDHFIMRTKETPVLNRTFDYTYLRSVELVFEKVKGDGVAYFGNLRAVKYEDYKDEYLRDFDFRDYIDDLSYDSSYFDFTPTVSSDGKDLTLSFTTDPSAPEEKKGFGFVKIAPESKPYDGNALSLKLTRSVGTNDSFTFVCRVVEGDGDVWVYKIPASDIPLSGRLLIPYAAFVFSQKGNGGDYTKQFDYIREIHFGLTSYYQGGEITISDLRVVSLRNALIETQGTAYYLQIKGAVISDFEGYDDPLSVYHDWETSLENKSEYEAICQDDSLGEGNHVAKFGYKTDLSAAEYKTTISRVDSYNAVSVSIKDDSNGSYCADVTINLYKKTGFLYSYTFTATKEWKEYTIPLALFTCKDSNLPIDCAEIGEFSIEIYKNLDRQYLSDNFVYVDNIRYTNASAFRSEGLNVG